MYKSVNIISVHDQETFQARRGKFRGEMPPDHEGVGRGRGKGPRCLGVVTLHRLHAIRGRGCSRPAAGQHVDRTTGGSDGSVAHTGSRGLERFAPRKPAKNTAPAVGPRVKSPIPKHLTPGGNPLRPRGVRCLALAGPMRAQPTAFAARSRHCFPARHHHTHPKERSGTRNWWPQNARPW